MHTPHAQSRDGSAGEAGAGSRAGQSGETGGGPRARLFPVGAGVTVAQLDRDPHPVLARLRAAEPVSWVPSLDGWLVTRHDLVLAAMRDAARFTVDDPRFSTAQVIGPSMLSLDGAEHARHREPFVAPFRAAAVAGRFAAAAEEEAGRLVARLAPAGGAELRREFAGPLSAAIVTRALGLGAGDVGDVLAAYEAIVASVTAITAGDSPTADGAAAFDRLGGRLRTVISAEHGGSLLASAAAQASLSAKQIVSNAAVLLFGGIETTEGMIANAVLHLLRHPDRLAQVRDEPARLDAAIDESLRLEPAAAVVDRYATTDVEFGGAVIAAGELVRLSIAGANRDPAVFAEPDAFDPDRARLRRHVAFAQGPHVCVGVHLARLEARLGLQTLLSRLPGLALDPERAAEVRGLVFRKPRELPVVWERH
ncbi:MAG TPA: cytochrome P450 [Solirubrobacteraceae bacterium]|nr:cytochrome P450 [Solirubrobacteraceae bacterium]